MTSRSLRFGSFRLLPDQRVLLRDGRPVAIGSRALDILIALSERPGEVVSKRELLRRVWPATVVEEANLRVHVAALRKVLGDNGGASRIVANVPGRGYALVAPLPEPAWAGRETVGNLPPVTTPVIGRREACEAVKALLAGHRFVTIVGAGGIGKTTLALAVAEECRSFCEHGVWFVDLASLPESRTASSALAALLDLPVFSDDPVPGLVARLRRRRALIVFDNCEHVIDSVARLTETLVREAPGISVLATSREALRADGEWQYRAEPLDYPIDRVATASEARDYPAVALFLERAAARAPGFGLADADVAAVVEICRKVDGIPLAIELAAATIDLFGVRGLAARLDDHLATLIRGRRTALPRHKTIRAALDWSYDLLDDSERRILRRLAVFAGSFDLRAAVGVTAGGPIGEDCVIEGISGLAAKSLLAADVSGDVPRYRLLHVTRAYAREKLRESEESAAVFCRHAEYVCELLAEMDDDWETASTVEWLARYAGRADDLRSALDWAFSGEGDGDIGVALTVASALLWIEKSLLDEYRKYLERALAHLSRNPWADSALAAQVHAALGNALFHTRGPGPETTAAFENALGLADEDVANRLRAFSGLCASHLGAGDYAAALSVADAFGRTVGPDPGHAASLIRDRLLGLSLSFAGELPRAREIAERLCREPVPVVHRTRNSGVQFDQRVACGTLLARTLWLMGFQDRALEVARDTLSDALCIDHAISLCYTLATAAYPMSCWAGDRAAAERCLELLSEESFRHSLVYWQTWARGYAELARRGDEPAAAGSPATAAAVGPQLEFFATVSPAFAARFALRRAEEGRAGWATSEILRAQAETLVEPAEAEGALMRAIEVARRQHALSFELRAECTLAALWRETGKAAMAAARLDAVLARFVEGFDRPDLARARAMLASLGSLALDASA